MKSHLRLVAGLLGIMAIAGMAVLLFRSVLFPRADSRSAVMEDMPDMPDMKKHREESVKSTTSDMSGMSGMGTSATGVPGSESRKEENDAAESGIVEIPQERLRAIGVRYETAARRPLDKAIRTVGRVAVNERRLAKVSVKFHGWIERLFVSATGDHVKKGQELFTIYSPDLVATQEEYLLALEGRKRLGGSEFPEVAQSSQELLKATRHRLHLWDITEDHIRHLERTKQVTKTLPIHSPITGTVIRKDVLQGTHVEPGEELYTIADLSRLWILADIYEYELPYIKVGQEAAVTLSYDPGFRQQARVGFIYPTLDPKTRTAKVRFEIENSDERLKPDMYANVQLAVPLGTRLAVPRDAVLDSGERQIVFVHHGGGTLEWRTVRLGVRAEGLVEVTEGVKEGDHVVTSANFLIDSESQLKAAVRDMAGMSGMK